MKSSVFLETVQTQVRAALERGKAVGEELPPDELNWAPSPERWSIGQIFEHMSLATENYLPPIKQAIESAPESSDIEVTNTWFGKIVIKASGPTGNAPVPKKLAPEPGPYNRTVVTKFVEQHEELLRLIEKSHGKDISSITIRNPVVGAFRMNLADCYGAMAAHADRHVAQIEAVKREFAVRLQS